jgi:hypothetical protein
MAVHYRHPKLVSDGRHTSAPRQRSGESIAEYTVNWTTSLCTQGIFGQVYSDSYFLELYLQNLRTELLLALGGPIESLLKDVPPNSPVYHTLTPKHLAATIQGHARRLGIEKLIGSKDKDTHLVRNLGEGENTDADSSSALPPDDIPDDELDYEVIHVPCAYVLLPLALVVILPNDRPPRKDARPRQDARPRPDRHPQKVRGLQDSDTDLPVMNPWTRIFTKPVTGLSTW